MSESIDILVAQEVDKLKKAGYKKVAVSRSFEVIRENYYDILLGNDVAIVEDITLDARTLLVNTSMVHLNLASPVSLMEEQFANISSFKGFLAKVNLRSWIHNDGNHYNDDNKPSIIPIKIHFIRITPLKN